MLARRPHPRSNRKPVLHASTAPTTAPPPPHQTDNIQKGRSLLVLFVSNHSNSLNSFYSFYSTKHHQHILLDQRPPATTKKTKFSMAATAKNLYKYTQDKF